MGFEYRIKHILHHSPVYELFWYGPYLQEIHLGKLSRPIFAYIGAGEELINYHNDSYDQLDDMAD